MMKIFSVLNNRKSICFVRSGYTISQWNSVMSRTYSFNILGVSTSRNSLIGLGDAFFSLCWQDNISFSR